MRDVDAFGLLCPLAILAGVLVLMIVIWWRIFDKTGHGGAMSLLMLIPVVNLIMLLVLAFGEWPIEAEVRRLRRDLGDRDDYRGYGGAPQFGEPRGLPRREPEGEGETGYTR